MSRKKTTEEFIKEAILIHSNKYDYSECIYDGAKIKIKIKCNICLDTFLQLPSDHVSKKCGCPKCGGVKKSTTQNFILKATAKHPTNKYDYSNTKYINARIKIQIKCNDCDMVFLQTPRDHLSGYGCPQCPINNKKLTTEGFIIKAKEIHGNNYDYSASIYTDYKSKILIGCKKCKKNYEQRPTSHLEGKGCPDCCQNNISKQEISWLNYLGIALEYRNIRIKIGDQIVNVDAIDPFTNIIYEFNGDYWHGNPQIFNPNDLNKNNKQSFGDLYQKTINRENLLINAGYKVISIWESDWKKQC